VRAISIEQVAVILSGVRSGARVLASGNYATPLTLLGAVDACLEEYRLHLLNAQVGIPRRPGVTYETAFVGPGMRNAPGLVYIPSRLSMVPVLLRDHCTPDVLLLHTATPRDGALSLGIEVNILPAALAATRQHGGIVIAQVNPQMPWTSGDAVIDAAAVDYAVEVDEPLHTHAPSRATDVSRTIGRRIADLVPDGATLQLGIGAIPDAVLADLAGHRGLRVWSETFSDGVLHLQQAGAMDPDTPITASFVLGSAELYRWLHGNDGVQMLRTETTNSPAVIARQPQMTSINAAMQVDLLDQANASRINARIYSGFGGSTDFIVGALHSRGGRSIMALPSWHAGTDRSTIVPLLTEPVTSMQHSFVATEHGIARVLGCSQQQQARNLITHAAHPDARPGLVEQGGALGLLD